MNVLLLVFGESVVLQLWSLEIQAVSRGESGAHDVFMLMERASMWICGLRVARKWELCDLSARRSSGRHRSLHTDFDDLERSINSPSKS